MVFFDQIISTAGLIGMTLGPVVFVLGELLQVRWLKNIGTVLLIFACAYVCAYVGGQIIRRIWGAWIW